MALLAAAVPPAAAEPYLAGYAGAAFTESKDLRTELELNGVPFVNGRAHDLKFTTPPVFGDKTGSFFGAALRGGNPGIDPDVHHFQPDAPRQTVTFSGLLAGPTGETRTQTQSADIDITAVTVNAI